jgi:hypothetical protein
MRESSAPKGHRLASGLNSFLVGPFGGQVPSPRVAEGLDLGGRPRAILLGEKHVVIGFRVERRIEVRQVNGFARDMPAKHVQVVAVEQLVFRHLHYPRDFSASRLWYTARNLSLAGRLQANGWQAARAFVPYGAYSNVTGMSFHFFVPPFGISSTQNRFGGWPCSARFALLSNGYRNKPTATIVPSLRRSIV